MTFDELHPRLDPADRIIESGVLYTKSGSNVV